MDIEALKVEHRELYATYLELQACTADTLWDWLGADNARLKGIIFRLRELEYDYGYLKVSKQYAYNPRYYIAG